MDQHHFDDLMRTLGRDVCRRAILRGLAGAGYSLGALRHADVAEAKKRKKKRKKKHKKGKRKQQQPTPPPPPDGKPRVDATCLVLSGSGLVTTDGNGRFAQSFTALASGPLVTAQLAIGHFAETSGDYVLRLAPVDGSGTPTNGMLAEATVANADVLVGESPVTFTFDAPAPVVAGTQYALVLTRPGGGSFAWLGEGGHRCLGRAFSSPTQTDPFAPVDDRDLNFMTFVIS